MTPPKDPSSTRHAFIQDAPRFFRVAGGAEARPRIGTRFVASEHVLAHLAEVCGEVEHAPAAAKHDDFDGPTEVGFQLALPPIGGRFRLKERLGGGGMGDVYKALDLETGREVAIKLPHLLGAAVDKRFELEMNALSAVVSPGTVGLVARGSADDPFLAMELVRGTSLVDKLMASGAFTPRAAHAIVLRVAAALAAVHLSEWVHRDIKPGNIILTDDGGVRLVDFGLARAIDGPGAGTETGQILGTLGYLAPEQLGSVRVVDPRTDVYALGCVFFECLTGTRAWKREFSDIVLGKWRSEVHPTLDTSVVPYVYRDAVAALTAVDPEKRPEDGLAALWCLLGSHAEAAPRLSLPPNAEQHVREVVKAALAGPLLVTGAACSGKSRSARAAGLLAAEVLAPASAVVLRANPRLALSEGAHASALMRVLSEAGFAGAAAILRGEPLARSKSLEEPALVLIVDDVDLLDELSRLRLRALARSGLGCLIATARSEGIDGFQSIRLLAANTAPNPLAHAETKELALASIASLYGTSFDLSAVTLLAASLKIPITPEDAAGLEQKGVLFHLRQTSYAFTTRAAYEAARALAPSSVSADQIEHFALLRDSVRLTPVEVSTFWRSRSSFA